MCAVKLFSYKQLNRGLPYPSTPQLVYRKSPLIPHVRGAMFGRHFQRPVCALVFTSGARSRRTSSCSGALSIVFLGHDVPPVARSPMFPEEPPAANPHGCSRPDSGSLSYPTALAPHPTHPLLSSALSSGLRGRLVGSPIQATVRQAPRAGDRLGSYPLQATVHRVLRLAKGDQLGGFSNKLTESNNDLSLVGPSVKPALGMNNILTLQQWSYTTLQSPPTCLV